MKQKDLKKGPLVAIDIGSYSIRAMAAQPNEDGTLRILGLEETSKTRAMKKGVIDNTTDVGNAISEILHKLKNRIGMKHNENIQAAFVSLGGDKLQSTIVPVKRDQLTHNYITPKRLKEMAAECKRKMEDKYPDLVVFYIEPVLYILDDEAQLEPPTEYQKARYIEVQFNVFVMPEAAFGDHGLHGAADRGGIGVENVFAKPEVLLAALCTEEEMNKGVALLDFGHQTTTLSIYKENAFRQTYVMPRGGYHITRDIQDMQITFEHAQQAKERFGSALEELVVKNQTLNIPNVKIPSERVQLSTPLLARIIEAQLDETLEPIWQRLRVFQSSEALSQIYITGGGSLLRNLVPYLQKKTTLPVEYGSHAVWLDMNTEEKFYRPDYSALVGTLLLGEEYRKEHPNEAPKKPKIVDRITQLIIEAFTNEEIPNEQI